MNKFNSPYSAAITGGGFLYEETNALLPLLQSPDRARLLKEESLNNRVIHINAETSRKRAIAEISRRYDSMKPSFWTDFQTMNPEDQVVALFYVILKTYKIIFDLHVNVTLRKWNSSDKHVSHDDLDMEMNEISSQDAFVDSWSESTKSKVESAYLTILRKVNMLDADGRLQPVRCGNFDYYLLHGESWFLESCLLQPFEIEAIKKSLA
ncbi:MAG: BrxA family protein [Prevotella sp.]|jgi:hypothetical protein